MRALSSRRTSYFHILHKSLIGFAALVLAYLGVAALWSWTSVDEAVSHYPVQTGTGLSERQASILLKIEDPTFFGHPGVSLADGQGVTTISSAIARDLFLIHSDMGGAKGVLQDFYRAVFACCKRIDIGRDAMAVVLNANVSKERQLAIYAGTVYMGSANGKQVRGLADASLIYLTKPLHQTSDAEFIGLVAMIKAPNTFHPIRARQAYEQRVARVSAVVEGRCAPGGWFDTSYDDCKA